MQLHVNKCDMYDTKVACHIDCLKEARIIMKIHTTKQWRDTYIEIHGDDNWVLHVSCLNRFFYSI